MTRRIRQKVESEMPPMLTEASLHELIANRAYEHFLDRGAEDGHSLEDWLLAEHEVLDELRRGPADDEGPAIDAEDDVRQTANLAERLHA